MDRRMLEWLVIGGGISGTHLGLLLQERAGISSDRIQILDPHTELLAVWNRTTHQTGMHFLRSPYIHHIDASPWSIRHFIEKDPFWKKRESRSFLQPNWRPTLELFQAHTQHVLERYALAKLHLKGRATKLNLNAHQILVETTSGSIAAKRVVLALGQGEHLYRPSWSLLHPSAPLTHIFSPSFQRSQIPKGANVAVVGGGMSSIQLALALASKKCRVTLVTKTHWSISEYDFDPGWAGTKYTRLFRQNPNMVERRAVLQSARMVGTVPLHLYQRLTHSIEQKKLGWIRGSIQKATLCSNQQITLCLSTPTQDLQHKTFDYVVLATGFSTQRPGGEWLEQAIQSYHLPCAPCGYPILPSNLEWYPNLFVTGPLAELEIGPAARNIVGARQAAQKILSLYSNGTTKQNNISASTP